MKLLKPTEESKHLIVFIHGFTGSKLTWLNEDDSPKPLISYLLEDEYLRNKFHCAIYEYSTSLFSNKPRIIRLISKYTRGKGKEHSLPIKNIASNLKTQIEDRFQNYEQIIIVGHSMGGLVGKQLIDDILSSQKESKIKLFITLATPHLGEGLASIANVLFKNPQVVDLKLFSETIHSLTDSWIKRKNLPKRVYFTAQYDDVVKIGSTGLEREYVSIKHTFSNHSSIINPTRPDDDVIISLKKVLKGFFESIDDNNNLPRPNIQVFFSRGTPHNENQIRYIDRLKSKLEKYNIELVLSWSPTDPIRHIKIDLKKFNGCLVLALERIYLKEGLEKRGSDGERNIYDQILPTLWIHLEAAMAYQMDLPLLILREEAVKEEGMFDGNNHSLRVVKINPKNPDELDGEFIDKCISNWVMQVKEYKAQF